VRAAIASGAGDFRIVVKHILPNVMSHVIVSVTLSIPAVVLLESFLGFLGFAVKPPLISWGLMLQDTNTFSVLGSYPWILSPVVFVLITVFAFNALGDGLRDAIDPY
jgi:peptide/nickel transport system permease protein